MSTSLLPPNPDDLRASGVVFTSETDGYSVALPTEGWYRCSQAREQAVGADVQVIHPVIGTIRCSAHHGQGIFEHLWTVLEESCRAEVDGFHLIETGRTTVGGAPAAFLEFEGTMRPGTIRETHIAYVFNLYGRVFRFLGSASAERFPRLRQELAAALGSLSLQPDQRPAVAPVVATAPAAPDQPAWASSAKWVFGALAAGLFIFVVGLALLAGLYFLAGGARGRFWHKAQPSATSPRGPVVSTESASPGPGDPRGSVVSTDSSPLTLEGDTFQGLTDRNQDGWKLDDKSGGTGGLSLATRKMSATAEGSFTLERGGSYQVLARVAQIGSLDELTLDGRDMVLVEPGRAAGADWNAVPWATVSAGTLMLQPGTHTLRLRHIASAERPTAANENSIYSYGLLDNIQFVPAPTP